jgi:hypothetical protein
MRPGRRQPRPAALLIIAFAVLILVGTVLLMLPVSTHAGVWPPPLDALFTATSAVCVTGLVVVDTAWRRVLNEFASLFEPANRRAPLTEALLGVLSADPPTVPLGQTDESRVLLMSSPHLPLPDRIAVVEGEHGMVGSASPDPALTTSLLDGGQEAFERFEKELLAQDWPLTTWDGVAAEAGSHNIRGIAHAIGSDLERRDIADTSLGGVVTILEHQEDAGAPRFASLVTCETDEEAVGALSVVLTAAVIDAGQARFVSDWTEVVRLEDLVGEPLDTDDLARAAITGPLGGQGLRAWLISHHINLDGPVGRQDREHPDWMAAVSHVTGPWKGRYDVHVWSTGLLAVPIHHRVVKEDKAAYTTSHQQNRLMETALERTETGRALPDAFWIDRADVVGGDFGGGLVRVKIRITLADGTVHELRSTVESEMVESAEAVGSAFGYLLSIPIQG